MNPDIERKLKKIVDDEFNSNASIKTFDGCDTGSGYLGNYFLARISDERKTLEFFIKTCATGLYNQLSMVRQTFSNEIFFYNNYLPKLLKLQEEKNVQTPFDNVPKYYGSSEESYHEYIIFENMKSNGYDMYDRSKEADDVHLELIFKTVARYHALQFAFKTQKPDEYRQILNNIKDVLFDCLDESGFDKSMQSNIDTYFEEHGSKFFSDKVKEFVMNGFYNTRKKTDDYSIITQADLWCNNMLFKYDNGHPIDMKMFDFQLIRPCSPVCDLSVFYYTLSSKESLDKFDYYMKLYHDTLSDRLIELGSDPKDVYPFKAFMEHWRQFGSYGFTVAFLILKVMLAKTEEVRKVDDVLENGGHMSETFAYKSDSDDEFNQRITRIFLHFIEKNFI